MKYANASELSDRQKQTLSWFEIKGEKQNGLIWKENQTVHLLILAYVFKNKNLGIIFCGKEATCQNMVICWAQHGEFRLQDDDVEFLATMSYLVMVK